MRWKPAAILVLLTKGGKADDSGRPSNQSICDYYATKRYGSNTQQKQLLLVQSIVSLAYTGGVGIQNAPSNSTGIFNEGSFNGQNVYLRPWFDGSRMLLGAWFSF